MTARVVLSYGIYDGFTPMHVARLQALSRLGNRLIIGVASDALCAAQGSYPHNTFEARAELVARCRYVDRVIPQTEANQRYTDIVNYDISVFAMDARFTGAFDDLTALTQVHYLPGPPVLDTPLVHVAA